jgi:hypothetical protein
MFDGLVTIYNTKKMKSAKGKEYHIISIEGELAVIQLYCPLAEIPVCNKGEQVELTIDINGYGKPVVTKIVK